MTRAELILRMQMRHPHWLQTTIECSVKSIFEILTSALLNGERIEVRGFGSFNLKHRPARRARNPKNGEQVMAPAKNSIHFKAGKELRERVNQETR